MSIALEPATSRRFSGEFRFDAPRSNGIGAVKRGDAVANSQIKSTIIGTVRDFRAL